MERSKKPFGKDGKMPIKTVSREGVADEFVIDYYHCRIIDIQGLISIILQ